MKSQAKTFVVGDGIPQTKKRGLVPEQRRKIMEAIKKATSLGEIERLEKILSSGKIPSDFDLDPTLSSSTSTSSISQQNGDKKKEGDLEKDSKDTKSTEKLDSENENKERSNKNKDDTGEDEALADQEGDEEDDASRREIADAQVDIEMTE